MIHNSTLRDYENVTAGIDKDAIRKQVKKALSPVSGANYQKQHWPKWLEDRLTTLAIYSFSDKNQCNQQHIQCLRYYSSGRDYQTIAVEMNLKRDTVQKYVRLALNWVIDNTPDYLLINIPIEHTNFRLAGCPHCAEQGFKGDLIFDDAEGEYWCLQCGRYTP
jgi:hypothetical protein